MPKPTAPYGPGEAVSASIILAQGEYSRLTKLEKKSMLSIQIITKNRKQFVTEKEIPQFADLRDNLFVYCQLS
jgi:hypothetical protein